MIVKIKDRRSVFINGTEYHVNGTSLENVSYDRSSTKVSFRLLPVDESLDELIVEFDEWTVGISESDLTGLVQLLTRG